MMLQYTEKKNVLVQYKLRSTVNRQLFKTTSARDVIVWYIMVRQGYFQVTGTPLSHHIATTCLLLYFLYNQIELTKHVNSAWRIDFSYTHSTNIQSLPRHKQRPRPRLNSHCIKCSSVYFPLHVMQGLLVYKWSDVTL